MAHSSVPLPYFDSILKALAAGDADTVRAFGRHVHWGYWDKPAAADGTVEDFAAAGARLSRLVVDAAAIRDGLRVLDVGCGLGGTLAQLNDSFSNLQLVGLNVDGRQLERARAIVQPHAENRLHLVQADACRLPLADESFDAVLCVEAIFHFASRLRFFHEVRRVLKPGGLAALSDFVPRFVIPPLWDFFERRFKPVVARLYGASDMRCTLSGYRSLARSTRLEVHSVQDISAGTWPSYRVLRPLVRRLGSNPDEAESVIRRVQFTMRIGLLRYLVLVFRRPAS